MMGDQHFIGGESLGELIEVPLGLADSQPGEDAIDDRPADGADDQSQGRRGQGGVEEAADRRGVGRRRPKPRSHGLDVVGGAPQGHEARQQVSDEEPEIVPRDVPHGPGPYTEPTRMATRPNFEPVARLPALTTLEPLSALSVTKGRRFRRLYPWDFASVFADFVPAWGCTEGFSSSFVSP